MRNEATESEILEEIARMMMVAAEAIRSGTLSPDQCGNVMRASAKTLVTLADHIVASAARANEAGAAGVLEALNKIGDAS
jgi:hypothetical protein